MEGAANEMQTRSDATVKQQPQQVQQRVYGSRYPTAEEVGLPGDEGWVYDPDTDLFWSDQHALYYHYQWDRYFDPVSNLWSDGVGGWEQGVTVK